MTRIALLSGIVLFVGMTAAAQDASLRGTGRELRLIPKNTASFSGSLGISYTGADGASDRSGTGYGGSLSGTLVRDRVWFFAAAEQQNARLATAYGAPQTGIDAKIMANLSASQNFVAQYSTGERSSDVLAREWVPSSFLSMRYTGIVSDRMYFNVNVSRSKLTESSPGFVPASAD